MAATKVLNWIIYVLRCPRTHAVRYVGWTSAKLKRRLNIHVNDALRKPEQNHRYRWIASLASIGLTPVIEAIETGSGDGWADAERRWIAFYRATGARLVNGTDGGEGALGRPAWGTPEQRSALMKTVNNTEKIREARSAYARRRHNAQTPEQLSKEAARRNATMTPGQRSERSRRGHADRTAEQREQYNKAISRGHAARTPEQRSESARKWRASYFGQSTPEQRSEKARKREAAKPPEQRRAAAKKARAAQVR